MLRPRLAVVTAALLLVAGLTGCSSTADSLDSALSTASSAVGTSRFAAQLLVAGKGPSSYTGTAFSDSLTQLGDAEKQVTELEVGAADRAARARALLRIRAGIDAVTDAQYRLGHGGSTASSVTELGAALTALRAAQKAAQKSAEAAAR